MVSGFPEEPVRGLVLQGEPTRRESIEADLRARGCEIIALDTAMGISDNPEELNMMLQGINLSQKRGGILSKGAAPPAGEHSRDLVLHAVGGGVVPHLLLDEGEGDEGLGRLGLVEDLFEPGLGINVVEKHDLGVGVFKLHQGRPQNMQAALARSVGNNDDFFCRHVHLNCSIP